VKFTISIPRESCTSAKAKYSSSVVPPDPEFLLEWDLFIAYCPELKTWHRNRSGGCWINNLTKKNFYVHIISTFMNVK